MGVGGEVAESATGVKPPQASEGITQCIQARNDTIRNPFGMLALACGWLLLLASH